MCHRLLSILTLNKLVDSMVHYLLNRFDNLNFKSLALTGHIFWWYVSATVKSLKVCLLCFLQMESTLMDCTKLRFKFWITRCAVICTVQWSLRQWCAHRACLDEVKVWIFPSIFGNYSHFITLTILSTLRHLLKSSVFRWSVFFDFGRFWSMLVDLFRSRSQHSI